MTTKREAIKQVREELVCHNCGKSISKAQPMFETAWSGVYWCGEPDCAYNIMQGECEGIDYDERVELYQRY